MKLIHQKRLLNVAKALRESKMPEAFTMRITSHMGISLYGYKEFPCGTPACALGHYAARRDLQKTFKNYENGGSLLLTAGGAEVGISVADDRVEDHFGINGTELQMLFGSWGCGNAKTPKEAARYIESFVKRKIREAKKKA